MIENIRWLGHSSFKIIDDVIIYIDPYELKSASEKADIVLITHGHYDHCSREDIQRILKDGTVVVAPPSAGEGLPGDVRLIKRGERLEIRDVTIEAVAAYNTGKSFHPRTSDNVGYVVTLEGVRIYHAGDTDLIPEMEHIKADIVLLPCGGTYTMSAEEAAEAVKRINPRTAVPMHWGRVVGSRRDAEKFAKLCKNCEVRILEAE